ncbi:purine-nucleoside phosphorylase [bacterium]|nr:purine-nucleoside phosphorylase [bacterium]
MIKESLKTLQEIVKANCSRALGKPRIGLILGSGLGGIADDVREACTIPYNQIPHFVRPTIEGHAGEMVLGKLEGKEVCVMKGRVHFYEGYTMREITYPVRVMARLGIENLIITAATGGINKNFSPGDLVLITDHINFMGDNPLIGDRTKGQSITFTNMENVYDRDLISIVLSCAKVLKIKLQQGVYIAMRGPSYETPAETEMARRMGADLVGMSVVPESIVGKQLGLKILGISCVANMAGGTSKEPMNHQSVLRVAERAKAKLSRLLKEIVKRI